MPNIPLRAIPSTVRGIEVRAASLEDNILDRLGYREYSVFVDGLEMIPKPRVVEKPISEFSSTMASKYAHQMGAYQNTGNVFVVEASRELAEENIRGIEYWEVRRDTEIATCMPLEIVVSDSRLKAVLGIIKWETEGTDADQ